MQADLERETLQIRRRGRSCCSGSGTQCRERKVEKTKSSFKDSESFGDSYKHVNQNYEHQP